MPTKNKTEDHVNLEWIEKAQKLLASKYSHPPMAFVHTYGCQQNASDGEKIKGLLAVLGYGFTDSAENADLVIFNTCAVRENAEARVFGNVGALKPIKMRRKDMLIGLCGCMMQQPEVAEKIKHSYPYVDLVFGTNALHLLPELLFRRLYGEKRQFDLDGRDKEIVEDLPLRRDGAVKANLPVMYGCDNFCSYCIVPYVRGRERSRTPEKILAEAKSLAEQGYREITLLGQNVNSYGKGLEEKIDFSDLLERINEVPGSFRLRFMTSHPKDCTEKLLRTMAKCEKVYHHIHLPVQSGSNRILEQMNRKYTAEHYLGLIDLARSLMPDITFSSDIIVGFPGETREDFEQTLELVRRVRYHTLFTFLYSPRSGTKAAAMPDPISASEKSVRFQRLLEEQAVIRAEIQTAMLGETVRAFIDGVGKSGEGWMAGRTAANDIVEFLGDTDLLGQFVDVKIDRALNWALFGKKI